MHHLAHFLSPVGTLAFKMQHTDLEIGPTLSARLQTQLEEQFNHVSEYKRGFESFLQVLGKKLKREEQRGRVKGSL